MLINLMFVFLILEKLATVQVQIRHNDVIFVDMVRNKCSRQNYSEGKWCCCFFSVIPRYLGLQRDVLVIVYSRLQLF